MKRKSVLGETPEENERISEFLEITFSAMNEAMTIYDSNLCLVAWNEQYERLNFMPPDFIKYGASLPEAYLALAHDGAFGPGDPETLAEVHIKSLRDGPLIEDEMMHTPDGRVIRIHRFGLSNGGVCATLLDVTSELETQDMLRQSTKMDAIGRLTGGFAHDMNNVLATIMGNIELEQLDRGRSSDFLDASLDASRRGAKLTHQLLAFARKQPLSPKNIQPADHLRRLVSMLRPLIGETIDLEVVTDAGLWNIEADETQLQSTLVNLAINARDAMPVGGKLTIEANNCRVDDEYGAVAGIEPGQFVCFSATDTGTGMDQKTIENAFEPFFTTKTVGTGTGLGLAMAHGFVRQSMGHIKIYSEIDSGTTVKIYLPRIYVDGHSEPVQDDIDVEDPQAPNLRILVVEDDQLFRKTIVKMLEFSGYVVKSFPDGPAAIEALKTGDAYDILLTDVVLPKGMNGREVAQRATELRPDILTIYMSGYSENAIIHHGRLDADVTLLQKPFRRADVVRKIVNAIKSRK